MSETQFTVIPGQLSVIITRVFDASRALVYRTYTDPKLLPLWWGPKKYTTTVDRMEPRPGGAWRFIQRDPQGNEYGFHGVYHQALAPELLIYTFEWEGLPGHVSMETVRLEDQGGKTKVTDIVVFQTVEDRDGMYQSGMKEGSTESMNRFAELLLVKA
jgi:uncharacterized protein YndB with AHSA1/START domain